MGLYWGEGNKANKNTVRIGNTDSKLLEMFIRFMKTFFQVDRRKLKAHLQIFTDIDLKVAENYWQSELNLTKNQFYKTTVTISGKVGTYKKKSKYGVLTLYFGNIKLKNLLLEEMSKASL